MKLSIIPYFNSTIVPAAVTCLSFLFLFVFYGFIDVRETNFLPLIVLGILNSAVFTLSLLMLVLSGIYQLGHGKKISGIIYTITGIILITLLYMATFAVQNKKVNSIVFFGYSWGADMAYNVTKSLEDTHPDLRVLGTVSFDGIDYPGMKALGTVHSTNESILNIYQSRSESLGELDLLHGSEVVPDDSLLTKLFGDPREYESFDHFHNALGSKLEMDMDDYEHGVDHTNIDDNELVLSITERFILGLLKEAFVP